MMQRLKLKDRAFDSHTRWNRVLLGNSSGYRFFIESGRYYTACYTDKESLKAFFVHCCEFRHYSFKLKKCDSPTCTTCKPIWHDSQRFQSLHFLPSPSPADDGHYRSFEDMYGQNTTDEHRPSLKAKRPCNSIGFSASQQHVKNVDIVIQCEECDLWRFFFFLLQAHCPGAVIAPEHPWGHLLFMWSYPWWIAPSRTARRCSHQNS